MIREFIIEKDHLLALVPKMFLRAHQNAREAIIIPAKILFRMMKLFCV